MRDLSRVEAQQVTPLHERDPSFIDESSHVTNVHAKVPGNPRDVDQAR
jgi:hypothetical protein